MLSPRRWRRTAVPSRRAESRPPPECVVQGSAVYRVDVQSGLDRVGTGKEGAAQNRHVESRPPPEWVLGRNKVGRSKINEGVLQ